MHRLDQAIVMWPRLRKEVPSWFLERKSTPQTSFAFFFWEEKHSIVHWAELVQEWNGHCWLWLSPWLQQHEESGVNSCVCWVTSNLRYPMDLWFRVSPSSLLMSPRGQSFTLHKWGSRLPLFGQREIITAWDELLEDRLQSHTCSLGQNRGSHWKFGNGYWGRRQAEGPSILSKFQIL